MNIPDVTGDLVLLTATPVLESLVETPFGDVFHVGSFIAGDFGN